MENHVCTQAETIGELKEGISGLKAWQERQNGSLGRMADEMRAMKSWIMALLGTGLVSLAMLVVTLAIKK